ncbi:hypothetical protein PM082_011490 [Marasmius tenuissimus]|nr:hypothetical protein PM082_011490 [Marasmius tenuissimus]
MYSVSCVRVGWDGFDDQHEETMGSETPYQPCNNDGHNIHPSTGYATAGFHQFGPQGLKAGTAVRKWFLTMQEKGGLDDQRAMNGPECMRIFRANNTLSRISQCRDSFGPGYSDSAV